MTHTNFTKKECNRLRLKNSVNHIDFTFEDAINQAEKHINDKLNELKLGLKVANNNYDEQAYDSSGLMNGTNEVEDTLTLILDYENDINMNEQQLYCFAEMKLVHLFRAYEITLKMLIKTGYPTVNERDFFSWEKLREFCKTNGFNIKFVPSYVEVNQLRVVNNCIKHSTVIGDDVKNVLPEFLGKRLFSYEDLHTFYERARSHILPFLQGISLELESSLFNYSEDKLEKIVNEYCKVMDSDELSLLSQKISEAAQQNDKASLLEYLRVFAVAK